MLIPKFIQKNSQGTTRAKSSSFGFSRLKKAMTPHPEFRRRGTKVAHEIKCFFSGMYNKIRGKKTEVDKFASSLKIRSKIAVSGQNDFEQPDLMLTKAPSATTATNLTKLSSKQILEESCQEWALSTQVVDKLHIQDELIKEDKEKFKALCSLRMEKLKEYLAPKIIAYATNLLFRNPNQDEFKELELEFKEFDMNPKDFVDHMERFEDKLNVFSLRKTLDLHHFNLYQGLKLCDVKGNSYPGLENRSLDLINKRNLFEAENPSKTKRIITAFVKPLKRFNRSSEAEGTKDLSLEQRRVVDHQSIICDVNSAMNDLRESANSNHIPLLVFNNLSKGGVCGLLYQECPERILSLLDARIVELEADIHTGFSKIISIMFGNRKRQAVEHLAALKSQLRTVKTNTPEAFYSFLSQLEKYETMFEKIPLRIALTSKFIDLPGADKINILEVKSSGGLINGLLLDGQRGMMQDVITLDDAYDYLVDREDHHDRLRDTPLQPVAKHFTKGHVLYFVRKNPKRAYELLMQHISQTSCLSDSDLHDIHGLTKKNMQKFLAKTENKWAVKALQEELTANHLLESMSSLEPEILCDIIINDCSHQLIKSHKPNVALQMEKILVIKNKLKNNDVWSQKQELEEFLSDPENKDLKHNVRLHLCTLYLDELADNIKSINPETADQRTLVQAIKTRKLFDELKGMVGDDPTIEGHFVSGSSDEKHYLKLKSELTWSFIVREQQAKKKTWYLGIPDKQHFIDVICKPSLLPSTETKLYKVTADYVEKLTVYNEDSEAVKDDMLQIQRTCHELFTLQQDKVQEDTIGFMENKHKQNTDAFLGTCVSNSLINIPADGDYTDGIKLLITINKRQNDIVFVKPKEGFVVAPLANTIDIIDTFVTLENRIEDLKHKDLLLTIGYNYKDELQKNITKRFTVIPKCLRFWDRSEQVTGVLNDGNASNISEQMQSQGAASTSCLEVVLGHVDTYQKAANCHPKFREMCSNAVSLSLISLRLAGCSIPLSVEAMILGCGGFLSVSFAAYPKQLTVKEFNEFSEGEKQAFRDIQFLTDSSSMLMVPVLGACAVKDAAFGGFVFGNLQAGATFCGLQKILSMVPRDKIQAVYAQVTGILPSASFQLSYVAGMFGNISKLHTGNLNLYLSGIKKWLATMLSPVVLRYKAITTAWKKRDINGWQPFMLEVGKVLTVSVASLAIVVLGTGIAVFTSGAIIPVALAVPQLALAVWGCCETINSLEQYGGLLGVLSGVQGYLNGTGTVYDGAMRRAFRVSTKSVMSSLMKSDCYKDYEEQEILREYYSTYSPEYYKCKKEQSSNEAAFTKWKALHDKAVETWIYSQRKELLQQSKVLYRNIQAFKCIDEELAAFDRNSNNQENVDRINKTLAQLGLKLRASTVNILELLLFFKGEMQSHLSLFFNIDELPETREVIELLLTQRMKEAYIGGQIKANSIEIGCSNKFEERAKKHFQHKIEGNVFSSLEQKVKNLMAHTVFKVFSKSKGNGLTSADARQQVELELERTAVDQHNLGIERLSNPDDLMRNKCSFVVGDDDDEGEDKFFEAVEYKNDKYSSAIGDDNNDDGDDDEFLDAIDHNT
ncbi:MAG: hypothetical protein QS721_07855 [Candidatus Endonucleobacter sp. (ex Gigantidas childressi)]|nr:hypothetical protein [Candidatus Endonucleobacter sp. (ex Gigantidas childressi)]